MSDTLVLHRNEFGTYTVTVGFRSVGCSKEHAGWIVQEFLRGVISPQLKTVAEEIWLELDRKEDQWESRGWLKNCPEREAAREARRAVQRRVQAGDYGGGVSKPKKKPKP